MSVIIGMDPHKSSATLEVVDERGTIQAVGRYDTDKAGYAEMLQPGRELDDRSAETHALSGSFRYCSRR